MTNPIPTDWRALCAELLLFAEQAGEIAANESLWPKCDPDCSMLDRTAAALAQPEPAQDLSQLSDGYHTFAELYEHRHALCLALMRAMPRHCWFSLRHADGERCFGGNGWFIVGIEPPGGNSVTYHLPAELYLAARATGAVELEKGRPWDGHSAADVALRLKEWAALAQPEPQGPTDEELKQLWLDLYAFHDGPTSGEVAEIARAVLARWGRPAIEPDGPAVPDGREPASVTDQPTDKELLELMPETMRDEFSYAARTCSDAMGGRVKPGIFRVALNTAALEYAQAVLQRYGRPAIEPVPTSERPWEREGWCDEKGMCYGWDGDYWWMLGSPRSANELITHWLPCWALPVPQQEAE
jgi:hypothetical protein